MPELTDLSVIRALCEKYDFALSKGFGQNFIINPGIPTKIVDASGVDKRYGVIEIGPGIGVLTKELAKRAAKVVSIEVDERLPPLLAETMAGVDNFKLVLQDVLNSILPNLLNLGIVMLMYTLIRKKVKTGWLLVICIVGGVAINALGLLV